MEKAYLNDGAKSLAAPNWSDATGFADNAELVIDKSVGGNQAITAGVDQSGLTVGIDSLDIHKGASGTITGLKVDADTAATDGISNHGNFYLQNFSAGASGVINSFDCGPGSRNTFDTGTIGQTTVQGGYFEASESGVLTDFDQWGGQSVIQYNATPITDCNIMRGKAILKRRCTNLTVGESAHVTIDLDDAELIGVANLTNHGGRVDIIHGDVTVAVMRSGVLDLSKARRAFEVGTTSISLGGTKIIEGDGKATISNVTNIGNSKRSVGGYSPAS